MHVATVAMLALLLLQAATAATDMNANVGAKASDEVSQLQVSSRPLVDAPIRPHFDRRSANPVSMAVGRGWLGEKITETASPAARTYTLVKMEAKAKSMGAVCLDGTPGAFYISKAPEQERKKQQWVVHLQGGGWCYDEPTCYNRSVFLGGTSSYSFPKQTAAGLGLNGMMSDNCTVNPTFCNFNLVMGWSCDGASFAGNREDPVAYKPANYTMYFRGRRILDAMLDTLISDFGLGDAREVLFGGDSAGGLGAYQHANYVQNRLKKCSWSYWSPMKFKVAPGSGFFLFHGNVQEINVWPDQMHNIYYLSNWTSSDNACLDAYTPQSKWLCLFPQNLYNYIEPPIFVMNSAIDLYQTANTLAAEPIIGFPGEESSQISYWSGYNSSAAPGWKTCSGGYAQIKLCSKSNIDHMNAYMDNIEEVLVKASTFRKRGNGAFIYGCYNHNAELSSLNYGVYKVKGVSMQVALSSWWNSRLEDASKHSYLESGRYSYPAAVTDANPTCNNWFDGISS